MRKLGIGTAIAGALATAVIGLAATAGAAPTGPANAQDTINNLRSQGYTVIVNRIGNAPLDQAQVIAVRPGTTYERIDAGQHVLGSQRNFVTVKENTIYVDVK
ncbi:hypothetical protein [Mycolicibacterium sp. XJ1819]